MSNNRTGLATDPLVAQHDPGPGHPEQVARYAAVHNRLAAGGLLDRMSALPTRPATRDELALAHTSSYIELAAREVSQHRSQLSTGDTSLSPFSFDAATRAAGCVLSAVDAVFSGEVANAFCLVRPPGHHASADVGMGFCLFNNVAVAARYAQAKFGVERVLIVDWDVHHGNGTQDIFYQDGRVLFCSTHQSPWYPGTGAQSERGEGKGAGKILNCPLKAGSGRSEIVEAFQSVFLPAAKAFSPEVVFISAGFDSRIGDPLGQFTLSDGDFGELTRLLLDVADRAGGRLISVLEGGYNLDGLALAAESHVRELLA